MLCDKFGWNWTSGSGEQWQRRSTDKSQSKKLTWAFGSDELKRHDRFILRKLIKKYESNHRIFPARVINVQCPQTCRRQATCSSSLFCRIRACSASQLEVVDPVPKPVPLAQYCWDFSSVWVCTGTLAGVLADCMADRISWAFKIKQTLHSDFTRHYSHTLTF